MGQVLAFSIEYEHVTNCITCGVPIIMSAEQERGLRNSHAIWYCVNGHSQHWPQKSDEQILREKLAEKEKQLEFERERAARNYAEREKAEKENKRLKKRVANGVCPCCQRSFTNVARHMKTKHPDFSEPNT